MFDWGKCCTFAVEKEQEPPFPNPLAFPTAADLFDVPRGGAREPEVEKSLPTQGCWVMAVTR